MFLISFHFDGCWIDIIIILVGLLFATFETIGSIYILYLGLNGHNWILLAHNRP